MNKDGEDETKFVFFNALSNWKFKKNEKLGMGDELDEWEIIDEDKKDEEEKLELETPTGEEKPQQKRKLKFKFFEYTKNKLYNIAKSC